MRVFPTKSRRPKDHHLVQALELDATVVLHQLARRVWHDETFQALCPHAERWVAIFRDIEYDFIVRGAQWFDTRMARGGNGPLSLTMHMTGSTAASAMQFLLILTKDTQGADDATQ
jgi:hypothetical protein